VGGGDWEEIFCLLLKGHSNETTNPFSIDNLQGEGMWSLNGQPHRSSNWLTIGQPFFPRMEVRDKEYREKRDKQEI
jgi:hypothetical protein